MQPHIYSLAPKAASLEELIQKAKTFVNAAKAPATLKAYRNDWRDFESWCQGHQLPSLPSTPETVALYIADCASSLASGTITRRLTSITKSHQAASYKDSPATTHHFVVGETLKGIKRTIGTVQKGKAALLTEDLRRLNAHAPANLLGTRDRALALVGFAGAFRRSELAAIEFADLDFRSEGVVVTLPKSKTDQEQAGRPVAIPKGADPETCPVRALQSWLFAAGIVPGAGPVFRAVNRHGHVSKQALYPGSIARILKRAAKRAGYATAPIAGHSLRAGHVTQAAANGVGELVIMRQTGHKSTASLRKYIRQGDLFRQNGASQLGL